MNGNSGMSGSARFVDFHLFRADEVRKPIWVPNSDGRVTLWDTSALTFIPLEGASFMLPKKANKYKTRRVKSVSR